MARRFDTKDAARHWVWDQLQQHKAARFPFPPHGRIPNFAGAREAAQRLMAEPVMAKARCIKVNPDAPQRPVRELALARGVTVLVPTPRLRGGFRAFDPERIPQDKRTEAASLSRGQRWGTMIDLEDLPAVDVVVTGSVAATRTGKRCGKGHGYGDMEYAILRELGQSPMPVVTTVHPFQLVGEFPAGPHDLAVSVIVTPEETIAVDDPPPPPSGIDWGRLPDGALEEMPVLAALHALQNRGR